MSSPVIELSEILEKLEDLRRNSPSFKLSYYKSREGKITQIIKDVKELLIEIIK